MNNVSPLRYPGGKTKLYKYIKQIIKHNQLNDCIYVEPFAGGCGLALKLLMNNDVNGLIINDFDHAIYACWHSILNYPDEFCSRIEMEPVDIDHWHMHKMVYTNQSNFSLFELGFSTFYLNRTNRSGILNGGIIGGFGQDGKYKIDCRFNKTILIEKIQRIKEYSNRIQLYEYDACELIEKVLAKDKRIFTYFDPPYVKKGKQLYKNYFDIRDHEELKHTISRHLNTPWIVTYDCHNEIEEIYRDYYREIIDINYSAGVNKKSNEFAIYSNNLKPLPKNDCSINTRHV